MRSHRPGPSTPLMLFSWLVLELSLNPCCIQHRDLPRGLPSLVSQGRPGADPPAVSLSHHMKNSKILASRSGPLLCLYRLRSSAWRGQTPIWGLKAECRTKNCSLCLQVHALFEPLTFEFRQSSRTCCRRLQLLALHVLPWCTIFSGCSRSAFSSYLGFWRSAICLGLSFCPQPRSPVYLVDVEAA